MQTAQEQRYHSLQPHRESGANGAKSANGYREAEQAARHGTGFLDALLGNLPGFVYRCANDPQWTMSFASAGSLALTGHPPEDLLSGRVCFADCIHPEDRQRVWDDVQVALDSGRPFLLKYRIVTASGEVRWVSERGRGVYSDDGELLALDGFIMDISERVRAEESLREQGRIIAQQKEEIRHLSLPIIEVWDGVLTLPIVGSVDARRAAEITEGLLDAVVRRRSRCVILDLTAVGATDATIAEHLARIVQSLGLLGARGVLVGVQPDLARSFVALDVSLAAVRTLPNLRTALLACMQEERPLSSRSRGARPG